MNSLNRRSRMMVKYALILLSTVLTLLAVEFVSYIIRSATWPGKVIEDHLYDVRRDPDQGYTLKPNNRHHARKYYSGSSIIYDVVYTTDEYGRRTVGQEQLPGRDHLLLFGCSYPYGTGLRDEETLQYMLAAKIPANIYNYGVHGYGPQNMLAALESGKIGEQVSSRKGIAIYYYGTWDIERAVGSFYAFWSYDFPYYTLDDSGRLARHGSFRTGRPLLTRFYQVLNGSNFLRLIHFDFPFSHSAGNIRLTAAIIRKAQQEYQRQFHGQFFLLINSYEKQGDRRTEQLISDLQGSGIKVLYYPVARENIEEFYIPEDHHPNARMNVFLSEHLDEDLSPFYL